MTPGTLGLFLSATLLLNLLWFSAGALYFGLRPDSATKLLVPRSARSSPLFGTVSASVRFLGGMNLAFAVLSGLLLLAPDLFPQARQMAALCGVLALAHGTQFASNLPVVLAGPDAPWPVLRGLMKFIFLVDLTLMLANGALAAGLLMAH